MAEYIERETVKEAIGFVHLNCVRYGENKSLLDVINEIPAADAVEVVRCKDCTYSYEKFGFIYCTFGPYGDCAVPSQFIARRAKKKEGRAWNGIKS